MQIDGLLELAKHINLAVPDVTMESFGVFFIFAAASTNCYESLKRLKLKSVFAYVMQTYTLDLEMNTSIFFACVSILLWINKGRFLHLYT